MAEDVSYWICTSCRTAVLKEFSKCSKCGNRRPILKRVAPLAILAVFIAAGIVATHSSKQEPALQQSTMPSLEAAFITAVRQASDQYAATHNPVEKTELRRQRAVTLQSLFKGDLGFTSWTGKVVSISSSGPYANVAISLSDGIQVQSGGAGGFDTRIYAGTPIYSDLRTLQIGDRVVISGRFLPSPEDGLAETSLTEKGSMDEPSFLIIITEMSHP
jgi:hypothetical protein